jgi:hypothetical protein
VGFLSGFHPLPTVRQFNATLTRHRFPFRAALAPAGEPLLDENGFGSDKLSFQFRLAILEQHANDFSQILAQLFECGALRMSTRKPRHITHKQFCLWIALNHSGECSHDRIVKATVLSRKLICVIRAIRRYLEPLN